MRCPINVIYYLFGGHLAFQMQPIAITIRHLSVFIQLCTGQVLICMPHIWHIYVHTSPRYAHQVLGICSLFEGHIWVWHIFCNKHVKYKLQFWHIYGKCWIPVPMYHICHVSYIWNVAAIFVWLYMSNMVQCSLLNGWIQ